MSPQEFEVFAADLEAFDERDIEAACDRIGKSAREDGEPSFPSLGTLIDTIAEAKRARRTVEREQEERNRTAQEQQHMKDHPELYEHFDLGDAVRELMAKRSMPDLPNPHGVPVLNTEDASEV